MTKEIKRKQSFGGCNIDHFSPPPPVGTPKGLNVVISFEDALKLHLALGQILGHLNGYKRSTTAGRRSAVNLCIYTQSNRITVNEDRLKTS